MHDPTPGPTPDARAADAADAVLLALALGRMGIGAALLVASRRLLGLATVGRATETALWAVRMVAARDLGLACGALASRGTPADAARWAWAGVLADAVDCAASLAVPATRSRRSRRPALRPLVRLGTAALAGTATLAGAAAALVTARAQRA